MGLLSRALDSTKGLDNVFPLETRIRQFYDVYNNLNCIVLKSGGDKNLFHKIKNIIDRTGTVMLLPSGNPLILLRGTVDRELIAHRLSKSLNVLPLLTLQAESPEKLIKQLEQIRTA